LKLDGLHLNAEGCRLAAAEVVRLLEDFGRSQAAAETAP
jgi:hypothetical protein